MPVERATPPSVRHPVPGQPRGYSWPPFEPGNSAAATHGAGDRNSRPSKLVREEAEALHQDLSEEFEWIHHFDQIAVQQLCIGYVRVKRLNEYIWGIVDGEIEAGPPRGPGQTRQSRSTDYPTTGFEAVPQHLWQQLNSAQEYVLKMLSALGLTPEGRMRLLKDKGWAKQLGAEQRASLRATGRELRMLNGGAKSG